MLLLAYKRRLMDDRWSFERKTYGFNAFDTFFSHFSSEFLVIAYFRFFFIVKRLIVMP